MQQQLSHSSPSHSQPAASTINYKCLDTYYGGLKTYLLIILYSTYSNDPIAADVYRLPFVLHSTLRASG